MSGEIKAALRVVTLSTGAKVGLSTDIRPGVAGVVFTNPEGVEASFAISDEALGALLSLILSCGKTWQIA